jgi:fructokinase
VTRSGADAFGELVSSHLQASGVRVDAGAVPGASTSMAVVTLAAGSATYDFRVEWDVGALAPLPVETSCLHTGSLATALAPGSSQVGALLERERRGGRVTISYDPNVRPALLGMPERARAAVEHIVGLSDVVKVGDEDLRWLSPGRQDEDVAREWLTTGPALVVVTRGTEGTFAVTAQLSMQRPSRPIELVDTVGAGDSFTAGLLDGRSPGRSGRRRAPLAAGSPCR